MKVHLLTAQQLRKTYSASEFESINEAIPKHRKAIIGQERAVKALRFGLGNPAPGFNVYVSTSESDSKFHVIEHFLKDMATRAPLPFDWCYVNNFQDAYYPNALKLPLGLGKQFKKDIETFIIDGEAALIKTMNSDEFIEKVETIKKNLSEQEQELFSQLSQKAEKENFLLKRTPTQFIAIPQLDSRPMTEKEFKDLSEQDRDAILEKQRMFQEMLNDLVKKFLVLEKKTTEQIIKLEKNAALFAIEALLESLLEKYKDVEEVLQYLEELKNDILDNLQIFLQPDQPDMPLPFSSGNRQKKAILQRYEVNVLVDNSALQSAPIVLEINPTYNNLFGKIEKESVMGTLVTDFTLIREGALHRANGGYLIIPIEDLLRAPFSWENLKRALRNNQIEIEDPTERLGFITAKSLKPEAIPLHVQVVLIGQHHLFQLLYYYDTDFKNLFKVKAHFDSVMPASLKNLEEFCGYIYYVQNEESLLPVSNEALAKIIEQGHRRAEHQEKISTEMEETADLLREAHFYAKEAAATEISDEHIMQAIREKTYRNNLLQEKIKELIEKQVLIIELEGSQVGQVNALSVIDMGDFAFGRPSRITASVSIGKGNIIDIERESNLGGDVHTKGVMILSGYLFQKFGKDKPLSLSAQIVFEQSYSGVEGDSASGAELFSIISALSEVPIRQDIAVTGSVNQYGTIQAIGGVNEKIEGFFEACQQKGLTGTQGVIIPAANQMNLMLKEEVVEAVANGQFHIWAIHSIEEGVEILTGIKAGKAAWDETSESLQFEEGTVFDKVNNRLLQMTELMKKAAGNNNEQEN
jgi:lon-related putative ATP-dependent protease